MKKGFGFWVLLIAVGAALALLSFSSGNNSGSLAGSLSSLHEGSMKVMVTNRKQKESNYDQSGIMKNAESGNINLEDYRPVDPVPSSKAASRARPIEHGTPMNPHIPKPTPPSHTRYAFAIKCTQVIYGNDKETVAELHADYDPSKRIEPKGVLHRVAQPSPGVGPLEAEFKLFDKLFLSENPAELDEWQGDLNPSSKEVIPDTYALPTVANAVLGDKLQFERLGDHSKSC